MDFLNLSSYFRKTTIVPKYIINRNGVNELTLNIDCSSTVAQLRVLLAERLSNLLEDEQFIHSNGAPIHFLDEQNTIVSELLLRNSNIICLKSKLTKTSPVNFNWTDSLKNTYDNEQSLMESPSTTQITSLAHKYITITNNSETKSILLSDLLSQKTLEIDNQKISSSDMILIIYGLEKNKSVKELKIYSSCHDILETLVNVLKVNTILTNLQISGGINNIECIEIVRALTNNSCLQKLSLRRNEITSTGCEAIGEMLKSNKTLTNLDICRNKLCDDGIKFICEALMVNHTLKELDIYQTKISSNGVQYIARMLQMNHGLTAIDIGDNNINDNDITVIANALKLNKKLRKLAVKWSQITEKGALELIDALKINKTLTTVQLHFSKIPEDVATQLSRQVPQLKFSGLGICSVS